MTTQRNRLIVRKVICFISDTCKPYVSKNFPAELVRQALNLLNSLSSLLNEYYDCRGRFKKKTNISGGNKQRQKPICQAELAGREIKKIRAELEENEARKIRAEV